jgi:anti-anti-sigma factor
VSRRNDDAAAGPLVKVELLGLPLVVAHRSNEHHATLIRELAFVDAAADPSTTPAKLLTLAKRLGHKYARVSEAQHAIAGAVAASGGTTVDLTYEVTAEIADDAEALFRLYEEVDEFCRTGELVTLVMPPDVAAFRRWVRDEFCAQIRSGAKPTAWEPPAAVAVDPTPPAPGRPGRIVVREDLDLGGAARLRNAVGEQLELGVNTLEVDLSGCEFVDSTGISMLITTLARLRESGGLLVLVNVADSVRRTLEYGGVYDTLIGE